ncbi:MAG: hypothetical protein GWO10_21290, partial [candidate division Zixibacteria bacterium]|nr:hypothetical protein [Gammaproteobacteria bacterium]NIR66235.1 hypothetical protein [candidate division Zixibacteria bacterium]NIX01599.1 hypothetical protein [Phycisphaerae bacterium]
MLVTNNPANDQDYTGTDAGVFGIVTSDGTNTRTHITASSDDTTPTAEYTHTDNTVSMIGLDGSTTLTGTMSFVTNGWAINV